MIAFIDSHIGHTEMQLSNFISYTVKDEIFAQKLSQNLQELGMHCWLIPERVRNKEKYCQTPGDRYFSGQLSFH